MALSGLQLRCHAMFSRAGIPPDSETVEYAWLIDLQMGALSGQLTVAQVSCYHMVKEGTPPELSYDGGGDFP